MTRSYQRRYGKGSPGQMRPYTIKEMMKKRLTRHLHREMVKRGIALGGDRPRYFQFDWTFGDLNGVVYADTKSEARALIKKDLGLPRKHRLPQTVAITKQRNPAFQEALNEQYVNIQTCVGTN